jgi:hypothetical protein
MKGYFKDKIILFMTDINLNYIQKFSSYLKENTEKHRQMCYYFMAEKIDGFCENHTKHTF